MQGESKMQARGSGKAEADLAVTGVREEPEWKVWPGRPALRWRRWSLRRLTPRFPRLFLCRWGSSGPLERTGHTERNVRLGAQASPGERRGRQGWQGAAAARDNPVGAGEGKAPGPHPAGLGVPSRAVPARQAPLGALHPSPSEGDPPVRTPHAVSPTHRKRGVPASAAHLRPRASGKRGGRGWRGPRPRPTRAKPGAAGAAAARARAGVAAGGASGRARGGRAAGAARRLRGKRAQSPLAVAAAAAPAQTQPGHRRRLALPPPWPT